MKNFYDFIRRTSRKLNEAAGQVYDLTKEEDIFFTSAIAEDGNKYYQLRKLKNGKLTTSAIVDIGVPAPDEIKHMPDSEKAGVYYVITYTGSKYLFDVHNLDEEKGINGEPPIGSKLKLMWKEIKDVAKQRQQQTPEPAAPAANTPRAILSVSEDASEAQIKLAYRKLVLQFHPDRNPGDENAAAKFDKIQKAYDELTKPQQQQQQLTIEDYKELFKSILIKTKDMLELAAKEAKDEINNPNQPAIKKLTDDQKKKFLELLSDAPSFKTDIERNINNMEHAQVDAYGKLLVTAMRAKNMDQILYFSSEILIIALWPIMILNSDDFDLGPQQQQQGAPNQPQQQLTAEQYKELIKHTMRQKGIFELSMKKAIEQINNPTHQELKNLSEDERKKFLEFLSTAPSYKSQIERFIDKMEDNVINYFGPLITAAVNSQNNDNVASFCCTILMMALGQISEQQEKQKQQEDSQEHLLALARQLNNPKIRKGLVYMMNGNPSRLSVWAAEIKTPQDLQKKYEDWVRRGLIQ